MREIRFTYTLTEADLLEARRGAKPPQPTEQSFLPLLALALLITLLYATPAVWDLIADNHYPQSMARQIILGAAPWIYVLLWIKYGQRFEQRAAVNRLWKYDIVRHLPHSVCLNDDGLAVETTCFSTREEWAVVVGMGETTNLLLLYLSGGSYYILPKRSLPVGTDLSELRQTLGMRMNTLRLSAEEFARQVARPNEDALLPRIHFSLNPTEFSKARRLDPRGRWLGLAKDACIWVSALAITMWLVVTTEFIRGPISYLGAYCMAFLVLLVIQIILNHRRWRKAIYLHGLQVVDVTESGLCFSGRSSTQWIGWGAVQQVHRRNRLFVLLLRDGTFRCIP